MDSASCHLNGIEAYSPEPEVAEVLLRNKTCGARAVRAGGADLQGEYAARRSPLPETAQPDKNGCDRLSCERCNWPSRLWLHHTCRVAKPGWGGDENFYVTTAKPKARNAIRAPGKFQTQKHIPAASFVALSCVSSITSRCSSDEREGRRQKETATCSQRAPRLATVRPSAEAVVRGVAKARGVRRKTPSARNCGLDTLPTSDRGDAQFTRVYKLVQRPGKLTLSKLQRCRERTDYNGGANESGSTSACGANDDQESAVKTAQCSMCAELLQPPTPVLQQNTIQRPPLSRNMEKGRRFASLPADARSLARQQCSAGRDSDEQQSLATASTLAKRGGGAILVQSRCHTSSLRQCTCCAAEGAQRLCQDLSVRAANEDSRALLDSTKEDPGASIVEAGVEVCTQATKRILTRHTTSSWRHITGSLPERSARSGSSRKFEEAGAATWPKVACRKQNGTMWNVRETGNKADVVTASVNSSTASQTPETALVNQEEQILSKGMLQGASVCICTHRNEDKQIDSANVRFSANRVSGAAAASDSGIPQEICGAQGSLCQTSSHPIAFRRSSLTSNQVSNRKYEQQVNAVVQGCGLSAVAKRCEAQRKEAAQMNSAGGRCNRERLPRVCSGAVEMSADASLATPTGPGRRTAARTLLESEQPAALCDETLLEPRIEQLGSVAEMGVLRTKKNEFVACDSSGDATQLACLCERVEHFLDTVECFLQETDPQLRREKLYGLHAVFVSVSAG